MVKRWWVRDPPKFFGIDSVEGGGLYKEGKVTRIVGKLMGSHRGIGETNRWSQGFNF